MSSSSRSVTVSAPAQTTTHTIPNLKGGANPATPKLAGIITSSCILFAWVVCFIYWWWNRRREKQALAQMETNKKLKQVEGTSPSFVMTGPIRRTRSRATSVPMRAYPPGTKIADEKAEGERPHAIATSAPGERNRANVLSDGPRAQSPTSIDNRSRSPPSRGRRSLDPSHLHDHHAPVEPPHLGTGPLTPMIEVPTRDEAPPPPPKP